MNRRDFVKRLAVAPAFAGVAGVATVHGNTSVVSTPKITRILVVTEKHERHHLPCYQDEHHVMYTTRQSLEEHPYRIEGLELDMVVLSCMDLSPEVRSLLRFRLFARNGTFVRT